MSTLLLGEGAYSTVYDNKDYAIKITEIKNEEDLTACVRELYILRMHLPNTVPFRSCYYKWGCMHFNIFLCPCVFSYAFLYVSVLFYIFLYILTYIYIYNCI